MSRPAVEHAGEHHGSTRVSFCLVSALADASPFDLAYVNGAFHHIPVEEQPSAMAQLHAALASGGYLALFENNPWNPGTRLMMRRIPFDRGARMLSPITANKLVRHAGFDDVVATRWLFYFPRPLARLRVLEPRLGAVPLGAQYLVLARRT